MKEINNRIRCYISVVASLMIFQTTQAALDFQEQTFTEYDFTAHYSGDDLVGANFKYCTFLNCDFHGLNLTRADFRGATIAAIGDDGYAVDHNGSNKKIDFTGANLTQARFDKAILQAQGGNGGDAANGFGNHEHGGQGIVDFQGAILTGVYCGNMTVLAKGGGGRNNNNRGGDAQINFHGADLTRAHFNNTQFTLQKADGNTNADGAGSIDFSTSILFKVDFTDSIFKAIKGNNINFTEANITDGNFSRVKFESHDPAIRFTRANLTRVNFAKSKWDLTNMSLEFTGANLSYANFNSAVFNFDHSSAYFINGNGAFQEPICSLFYTNFSNVTVTNDTSNIYTNGNNADPDRLSFENTILLNTTFKDELNVPPVDNPITAATQNFAALISENLPNIDLTNVDLTQINLRGINLVQADLTGATLTGMDLTGATLDRVIGFDQMDYLGSNIAGYSSVHKLPQRRYLRLRNGLGGLPFVE